MACTDIAERLPFLKSLLTLGIPGVCVKEKGYQEPYFLSFQAPPAPLHSCTDQGGKVMDIFYNMMILSGLLMISPTPLWASDDEISLKSLGPTDEGAAFFMNRVPVTPLLTDTRPASLPAQTAAPKDEYVDVPLGDDSQPPTAPKPFSFLDPSTWW